MGGVAIEIQRELNNVIEDKKEFVEIGGTHRFFSKKPKRVGIRYMKRYTLRKMTDVMLDGRTDLATESKVVSKQAALAVLNGYFRICLFYPFLWRWYYYIKEYHAEQLLPIIECAKKKVPQTGYLIATASTASMKDTVKAMTREEVERFRQEPSSGKKG